MPTPPLVDPWLPSPGDSGTVAVSRPAIAISVHLLYGEPPSALVDLPNVVCMCIEEHEGPAPASAMFRYVFDGRDPDGPQSVEEALSTAFAGDHVVEEGDRIGVKAVQPDGTSVWIFDGFALTWQMRLVGDTEQAVIAATGVAKRLWDTPIGGAVYRNSQAPETVSDVTTDTMAQFNPKGLPNASPSTADSGSGSQTYPVFMDTSRPQQNDGSSIPYPRDWTLPMGAAWLIYPNNSAETYVQNPTRSFLDSLLIAREPIDGVAFDPNNGTTYTAKPIYCPDTPLTGRAWPVALHELIGTSGFGLRFKLTTVGGWPQTNLTLWLKQGATAKPIFLPARGSGLDPQWCNLGQADLGRDLSAVVNRWVVKGGLVRYEVSFILCPGFPSSATDASDDAHMAAFDASDSAFATGDDSTGTYNKYRLFILDESGEGHYAPNSSSLVSATPTSLDAVFGAPVSGVTRYVVRRRPPIGTLYSVDSQGRYFPARLAISTDYAGTKPGIWDGTGTWQHVEGGFTLLKDRIGIRINTQNPNKWNIGAGSGPFPDGKVNTIERMNSASPFFLRLTCVIESDVALSGTADVSPYSPLSQAITRVVDAQDRYSKGIIHYKSEFNTTGGTDVTARDDSIAATAEAIALRTASEAGVFEGSVVIPRFTTVYDIGDRISEINGRGLSLRTDNAGGDYAPVYPVVVGRRWDLDGQQQTTLTLSDSGLNRRRYSVKQPSRAKPPVDWAINTGRRPAPNPTVSRLINMGGN